jgi:type I restriction enzyme S subunit
MPELPHGWTWASLDQLAHHSNYGTSVKCDVSADGLAVLRIPNVQAGAVTWSNLKFATTDLGLETTDLLAPGDLLIVRTNGSPDLVGRAALVAGTPERPSYFASYLIRFRLIGSPTVQRWVASVFRSGLVRTQVARFAATSAGQYNVSQTNLAGFAIPLPPESEIEAALEVLTEVATDESALPSAGFADQLRQSILHAAFTGRLVPQDPADEPAAALLARLRATPAAARRPRARRSATQPDLIETLA